MLSLLSRQPFPAPKQLKFLLHLVSARPSTLPYEFVYFLLGGGGGGRKKNNPRHRNTAGYFHRFTVRLNSSKALKRSPTSPYSLLLLITFVFNPTVARL